MNELNKNLSDIFDVTPIEEVKKEKLPTVSAKYNKPDIESDLADAYQQSRENLQGIIDQGQEAMHE